MDYFTVQKATNWDIGAITDLLVQNFGQYALEQCSATELFIHYYVARDDKGTVIGASGILPKELIKEDIDTVAFTCVKPECRGMGVAYALLHELLKNHSGELTLYALHRAGSEHAEIHKATTELGFVLIQEKFVNRRRGISHECQTCVYGKSACACHDDLYVRADIPVRNEAAHSEKGVFKP